MDQIDRELLYLLNGYHSPLFDTLMWHISKMEIWIPVYAVMVYSLNKKYGISAFILLILFAVLLLFLTDFTAVHLIKNTVMRLRPSHNDQTMDYVNLVMDESGNPYRGGQFGFFSNHASNFFGVVTFYLMCIRPVKKWVAFSLYGWAILIGYSRIYMGVPYPGDVLAGALFGIGTGWLVARMFHNLSHKFDLV